MDAAERLFALVDVKYKEQKEFAAEIGVIPQLVSAWRKGTSKSFTKYLPQITAALGTTAEYILTGKENSSSTEVDELKSAVKRLNAENRKKALEYIAMLQELQDRK